MNKKDIAAKLKQIKDPSYYISVSEHHPLDLYLGKNEKNEPTLRFNGDFVPVKIKSSETLKVKQIKTNNHNSILFSYDESADPSFFYSFCEDIISNTDHCVQDSGYSELVNRFNNWKKLFSGSHNLLTEKEIMGLIGELSFLKNNIFTIYGHNKGIIGWTGSEPTKKDFSYDNTWFEVKTIKSPKNSVTISSLDQLDSEVEGKLVVYHLQKMSPSYNGVTLNRLAIEILNSLKLESDKEIFSSKLRQAGYCADDFYDDYVYEIIKCSVYKVEKDFPRIKKTNISHGIGDIQYELYLDAIEKYLES